MFVNSNHRNKMDCSNVISIPYIEGDDRNCPYQYKDARKHFQEHGWVVVEDLLTEKEFHQFSKTYKEHHMYRRRINAYCLATATSMGIAASTKTKWTCN